MPTKTAYNSSLSDSLVTSNFRGGFPFVVMRPVEGLEGFEFTGSGSSRVLPPPPRRVSTVAFEPMSVQENFHLLEKWDGIVVEADANTFGARLSRCDDGQPQYAVFSKDELTPEERSQIEVGAPFVWTIGYRDKGTTRHRDSLLYFRRLGNWEAAEISAGVRRAAALTESIAWK